LLAKFSKYFQKSPLLASKPQHLPTGGAYLKKSEPILLTGSASGSAKDRTPLPSTPPKSGSGKNDFRFFFGGKFF
jgi:hypothetical protein